MQATILTAPTQDVSMSILNSRLMGAGGASWAWWRMGKSARRRRHPRPEPLRFVPERDPHNSSPRSARASIPGPATDRHPHGPDGRHRRSRRQPRRHRLIISGTLAARRTAERTCATARRRAAWLSIAVLHRPPATGIHAAARSASAAGEGAPLVIAYTPRIGHVKSRSVMRPCLLST